MPFSLTRKDIERFFIIYIKQTTLFSVWFSTFPSSFQYAPSFPTCFNSTSFYSISFAIGFIVATYMTTTKEINSNKFIYNCPNLD